MVDEYQSRGSLLIILILFTLLLRLLTLQMINEGPDEIDYWHAGVRLGDSLPYPELTHRTVRWPIILPTAVVAAAVGGHPVGYYIVPLALSLVHTFLLFIILKRYGTAIATLGVLLFVVFPYTMRIGSQIRPEVFSITGVLVAWWALDRWRSSGRSRYLIALSAALFAAYLTKVSNVYFYPAIIGILWLHSHRLKPLLTFALPSLIAYMAEHAVYWITTGEKWGRLGIILNNHLSSDYAANLPQDFWGLFQRFSLERFPAPWWLLVIAAVSAYILLQRRGMDADRSVRDMAIMAGVFTVFTTFMVKSLDPLVPVEAFQNRYFSPILPLLVMILSRGFGALLPVSWTRFFSNLRGGTLITAGVLCTIAAVSLLPIGPIQTYLNPVHRPREHPIPRFFAYTNTVSLALEAGLPMITTDQPGGFNSKGLDTVNRVFVDYVNGSEPQQPMRTVQLEDSLQVSVLGSAWVTRDAIHELRRNTVLFVERNPLRVSIKEGF